MTLGEHITLLRAQRNWSQDDLAARLGVSRQSVSKWETDASIPDLDKLLAMSGVFGVTLDELVKGEKPPQPEQTSPQPEAPPQPQIQYVIREDRTRSPAHTAGVILLCFGFAVILLLTLLGGLLEGLVFSIPFFVCSLICFICKKHPGLWCGWTVVLGVIGYLQLGTGISWQWSYRIFFGDLSHLSIYHIITPFAMLFALLLMIFLTLRAYRNTDFPLTKRNKTILIVLWAAVVLTQIFTRINIFFGDLSHLSIYHIITPFAMLFALLLMIFLTLRAYRNTNFPLTKRNKTILIVLWAAVVLTQIFSRINLLPDFADWRWRWLTILQDALALAALLPVLIVTYAAYRTKKKNKENLGSP